MKKVTSPVKVVRINGDFVQSESESGATLTVHTSTTLSALEEFGARARQRVEARRHARESIKKDGAIDGSRE